MQPFEYQEEADKTCSIVFNPQYVSYEAFVKTLRQFSELADILNLYKKLLFRGKTPEALGMNTPEFSASLAGNGGHINGIDIDLVHGILGCATENGESVEILIDLLEGKAPDRVNAVEEVGDQLWYQNRILRWAGVTFNQAFVINIDKLHGRHGDSFDVFRDANRDLERERERLEALAGDPAALSVPEPTWGQVMGCTAAEIAAGGCIERRPAGDCEGMDC